MNRNQQLYIQKLND